MMVDGKKQDGEPGVHRNADGKEIWTCHHCHRTSDTKPEVKWVVCCVCECKFDAKCQNIRANHFSAMNERQDMFWACPECMTKYCPDPARGVLKLPNPPTPDRADKPKEINLDVIYEKLVEINDNHLSMEGTLNTLHTDVIETTPKSLLEDLCDKLDTVQTTLSAQILEVPEKIEERKTFAEILKTHSQASTTITNPVSMDNIKKALLEATEEEKDQEVRSRGIVIYRAIEEVRSSNEPNQQSRDDELVRELVNFLEGDESEIISVNRLGKLNPDNIENGRYRPLKVRFKTNPMRDQILSSLSKLRHANEKLKTLSIRQDLNYQQRQELNNKVKEAREMSLNRTDKVIRVRGTPGNYKFVEFPKNSPPPSTDTSQD